MSNQYHISSRILGNEQPALPRAALWAQHRIVYYPTDRVCLGLVFCILYPSLMPSVNGIMFSRCFPWSWACDWNVNLSPSPIPYPLFLVSVERNSADRVAVWSYLCSTGAGLINTQSEQSQVIPSCVNKSQNTDTNLIHPSRVPVWIWNISCKNIKFFSFSIHCHWFP